MNKKPMTFKDLLDNSVKRIALMNEDGHEILQENDFFDYPEDFEEAEMANLKTDKLAEQIRKDLEETMAAVEKPKYEHMNWTLGFSDILFLFMDETLRKGKLGDSFCLAVAEWLQILKMDELFLKPKDAPPKFILEMDDENVCFSWNMEVDFDEEEENRMKKLMEQSNGFVQISQDGLITFKYFNYSKLYVQYEMFRNFADKMKFNQKVDGLIEHDHPLMKN